MAPENNNLNDSVARFDLRMALNAEIVAQGHSEEALNRQVTDHNASSAISSSSTSAAVVTSYTPAVSASCKPVRRVANTAATEWNLGGAVDGDSGDNGERGALSFQEHWPSHLPRPPSRKKLTEDIDEEDEANNGSKGKAASRIPRVIVFNANTQEGSSMVRVLSDKGLKVVAVVRVFTSRNTKNLIKLKNVTVKVADLNNKEAVLLAAKSCQQAFLVTKYWERFESPIEEQMAKVVLASSAEAGIKRLVLATFEDTAELRAKGRKSQLVPTVDGRIFPRFEGMDSIDRMAKSLGVQITHMMTSYLDDADCKRSLILIRGENGKIITQPYVQDLTNKNKEKNGAAN